MALQAAQPGKTRVGWIGTGVMGRWMCQHLLNGGYKATVYNRSKDKAAPLLEAGAAWADTPKAVAEQYDVVFAIVGFPKDVREVFLGPDGALAGSKAGNVLVDMTTSDPSLAREIYAVTTSAPEALVPETALRISGGAEDKSDVSTRLSIGASPAAGPAGYVPRVRMDGGRRIDILAAADALALDVKETIYLPPIGKDDPLIPELMAMAFMASCAVTAARHSAHCARCKSRSRRSAAESRLKSDWSRIAAMSRQFIAYSRYGWGWPPRRPARDSGQDSGGHDADGHARRPCRCP